MSFSRNYLDQVDVITTIVSRVFEIEDVTYGDMSKKQNFLMRFRGKLYDKDTVASYERLSSTLKEIDLTPLFRMEDGRQIILLVPGMPEPSRSNPWVNVILFILTFISVWLTGGLYGVEGDLPADGRELISMLLLNGFPFAVSMIAILGAHEFGHYLAGRFHGVHVTLPYFIPLPFSPFGTMGAFINMKEAPKNRRQLLDIGLAGPLAGFVVAVPLLILGLHLSSVEVLPATAPDGMVFQLEGNSILYLLSKYLVFGKLLPQPESYGNLSPFLYWLKYFFTGRPFPFGGLDVMLHPVAWAGWAGLLVTAINLIPAGQLDGGHMLYVLFGRKKAEKLLPFILGFLGILGFVWSGWWLWAVLIFLFGRAYAEPLDQITTLDRPRKILALTAFVIFFLTFIPVPLNLF